MVHHIKSMGSVKKTQLPRPHPGPIKLEPRRAGPWHCYFFSSSPGVTAMCTKMEN